MVSVVNTAGAILLAVSFPSERQMLATYGKITDRDGFQEFYRSVFEPMSFSELETLATSRNDSIATQSVWERVVLTVPEERGGEEVRPDRSTLNHFLGFFEGRNRVLVPKWWRQVVADSRAHRRNNIFPGKPQKRLYHRTGLEGVKCPSNATVVERDRIVTYQVGRDSIVLPEELLDRDDSGELWCNICCTITRSSCFVAVHGDVGHPHIVACIDRSTNEVTWSSKACGCWWAGASGRHESWVTLVPTNDGRVFVFGAASVGIYAHGFDVSDGATLVQFSDNY